MVLVDANLTQRALGVAVAVLEDVSLMLRGLDVAAVELASLMTRVLATKCILIYLLCCMYY